MQWRQLRRLVVLPIVLLWALGCCATAAFAVPRWEVSVAAENPIGEPSFERSSSSNLYKVTVKNVGDETAGGQVVGNALECEAGPATAASLKYQWLRNGVEIAGATSKSYIVAKQDEGHFLECEVLASSGEATTAALSTQVAVTPIPAVAPPSGGKPTTTGTLKVGETLTCTAGTWTPAAEHYEYVWLRNGAAIPAAGSGSTTATTFAYKFVQADAGAAIQCEVIASNTGGSVAVMVAAKIPLGVPPVSAAAPVVTGTAQVGEKLTCTNSSWTGSPTEYEYQWLRNGSPIAGARLPRTTATSFTYTLQSEDSGAAIQCDVTAMAPEGTVSRVSVGIAVGTFSPAPSVAPTLTLGAAKVGTSLSCSHGTWSPAATSYEFKWLRNGVVIAGSVTGPGSTASSAAYVPVTADEGKALQCEVTATNAGGSFVAAFTPASFVSPTTVAATAKIPSAAVTLTNVLPPGLEEILGGGEYPIVSAPGGWSCRLVGSGRSTEQCSSASDSVAPGQTRAFEFGVIATSAAADIVNDTVTVSGGGASPSSTTVVYPTTITPGDLGIESFWASVLDEFGTPFTQSTGHPFEAKAMFVFRPTFEETGPESVVTAGGEPKNIAVELPPGFIGAPALAEHCPVKEFHESLCQVNHPNSAIGYINIATFGHIPNKKVVLELGETAIDNDGQTDSSLIYNLTPPAGTPAAFGFDAIFTPFYLTASVRSDSDYGVTITSVDSPTNPVRVEASEVVFCGYGAYQVLYGYQGVRRGCRAATPGKTSFLSNPASCTGTPPQTTLKVNTWEHPDTYASKTVYTGTGLGVLGGGASASESLVEGCDRLAFHPRIEPTPNTTRADAPTGLSVDLKVPQENSVPALAAGERVGCVKGLYGPASDYVEESNAPTGYAYQWLHNGVEIFGATGQSYTLAAVAEAKALQCRVNASNAGGAIAGVSLPLEVSASLPAAPATGPTVSGSAEEGKALTCAAEVWTGSPTGYAYQWFRNGAPIAGATGSTYTVQAGDAPSVLQCQVTATNASGSVAAMSANDNTIPAPTLPPVLRSKPEISAPPAAPGTPEVKNTVVKFPAGMSLSPSAADGLAACSDAQFAVHSLGEAECPDASKIGTVKITTPLLPHPLEGQLFLGEPLCGNGGVCSPEDATSGRMFRLFIQAIDREDGIVVKVPGSVSVDLATGGFTASFLNTPQLPFENLELRLKNGPRAPLATPQVCGPATTTSTITPWSTSGLGGVSGTEQIEGTPDATSEESFTVDWDGHGGACPSSLPFVPGFSAGTSTTVAGAAGSNELTVSLSREDREQGLGAISVHTPSGLLGEVSKVTVCGEPQAQAGTCGEASRIGTVTAGAGPGAPFYVSGPVYLTTGYKGAPYGLSIVVPTKAGPFNLGNVVVRASVNVDPHTAELTVTSDPLPQVIDGIPLRLRSAHVTVDRHDFILNPTNCTPSQITATITGAPALGNPAEPVKTSNVSSPFDVGGCASVPFKPAFTASTQANLASRKNGASLHVDLSQKQREANIHSVRVELPKTLPARLTTLQKACTEAQFAANPAGCPSASLVGSVVAHTPILPVPLAGPAYFVSHGGAKFPELILVLQGDGVTIELDGETFIDPKTNVTSSTFKAVPDAPVDSFELTLPTGPYSALAAPGGLQCGKSLFMPTVITGQNGIQVKQRTTIKTVGCTGTKKLTKVQKLKAALKACKKLKSKSKRAACVKRVRKKYAKTAKKASKPAKKG